uniref:leucine-rich repeat-containing protein 42 n=1 Tax=Myxine glutinosa TaxID=7769 RepID=UPI00358EEA47
MEKQETKGVAGQLQDWCEQNERRAKRPRFSTPLSNQRSPSSLLDLTVGFVASHLQLLDSLRGFPEQLGRRIFSTAVSGGFLDPRDPVSICAVRVFGEAYGDVVFSAACFRNRPAFLRCALPLISEFEWLCKLDVSHCRLSDRHPALPHIGQRLFRLQVLSLASNELSDAGMRMLTGARRVGLRGLALLHTLNLAGNAGISSKGVALLACFQHLKALDLSGTAAGNENPQSVCSKLSLTPAQKALPCFSHQYCRSVGWAASLLDNWTTVEEAERHKPKLASTCAARFYGMKPSRREEPPEAAIFPCAHYHRTDDLCSLVDNCAKELPGSEDSLNRGTSSGKGTKLSTFTSVDEALLEQYSEDC